MANWGNNDGFRQQKKRNFIYKAPQNRPVVANTGSFPRPSAQHSNLLHETESNVSSPRKKIKSSHGIANEQAAAEELFRDLPPEAFDDADLVDDFGIDDEFTAEELCEAASLAERQNFKSTESQKRNRESVTSHPDMYTETLFSGNLEDHDTEDLEMLNEIDKASSSIDHWPSNNRSINNQGTSSIKESAVLSSGKNDDFWSSSNGSVKNQGTHNMSTAFIKGTAVLFSGKSDTAGSTNCLQAGHDVHSNQGAQNMYVAYIKGTAQNANSMRPGHDVHSNQGNISSASIKGTAALFSGRSDNAQNTNYVRPSHDVHSNQATTHSNSKGLSEQYAISTNHENAKSYNNGNREDDFIDSRAKALQKEIEELKEKFDKAQRNVLNLEEEKYGKDGELKMLRDSLAHFQAEETKKRDQIRAMEEQRQREQTDKEKELQKQVETLTTRLTFKEQEITQIKEQRRKQAVVGVSVHTNEGSRSPLRKTAITGSPHRKKTPSVNNSDNIPMGSSFFEKGSQESRHPPKVAKSPVHKTVTDKLSDNSENSYSETVSKSLSGGSTILYETTEANNLARGVLRMQVHSKGTEVELVQKLFKAQNAEICKLDSEYEVTMNDETLVPLLRKKSKVVQAEVAVKSSDDLDIPPTLLLFETQLTKKTQSSSSSKDGKPDYQVDQITLAFETVNELLNSETRTSRAGSRVTNLDLNGSQFGGNLMTDSIHSAVGLIPVLESHVSLYSDLRLDTGDDSLTSTCSANSQADLAEQKEAMLPDREGAQMLSEALHNAVRSLRCLNVLILYSQDVREVLFRSLRIPAEEENDDAARGKANEAGKASEAIETCLSQTQSDLLGMMFKLLVLQPNEPPTVMNASLHVLASLAQHCSAQYQNRLFPLLSEGLLAQCLARDWTPMMVSLVTSVLTPMAAFSSGVLQYLCPQADECILLKLYQDVLYQMGDVRQSSRTAVQLQVLDFLSSVLSSHGEALAFLLDTECHCTMELVKTLVLLLYKEMKFLQQSDTASLTDHEDTRSSLTLLRQGMFLLSSLCTNDRLFVEHRMDVEHQFANLISGVAQLYKALPDIVIESEVLALQDLSYLEHNEEDILPEFGEEEDTEVMDIDG